MNNQTTSNTGDDPLRYAFVEMLFALAVSQVAIHAADLVGASGSLEAKSAAIAHLFLGLIVIAASWVGWRQSQSPGMKEKIESLFSRRFVALLFDVALVIVYFILVRGVELQQKDGLTILEKPSARLESLWIVAIFSIYIAWDLLADILSPGCIPPGSLRTRFSKAIRVFLVSCLASGICLCLSINIYKISNSASSTSEVILLDAALLTIVLLFRLLKGLENPLSEIFQVRDCQAFITKRVVRRRDFWIGALLFTVYLTCVYSQKSSIPT